MKYYLCTYDDNWADEMDITGFCVVDEEGKEAMIRGIKVTYKDGGSISFGTNEDNEYDDADDVLATVSFKQISKAEYNTINRLFGGSFGEQGPMEESAEEWELDEEEEEERYCDVCGGELDEHESDICDSCDAEDEEEEEEYDSAAKKLTQFIKSEFSLVPDNVNGNVKFFWKPTPKSEIRISIPSYSSSDSAEMSLTINNKKYSNQFLDVASINKDTLRKSIKALIETAKQKFNG